MREESALRGADEPVWAQLASLGPLPDILGSLVNNAPQCLLLEGGSEARRQCLATYWAALLNCTSPGPGKPCLECNVCRQIAFREYRDFLLYDGRISNRDDEENPGTARALSMENTRELKRRLGDAGSGRRVVLLSGLSRQRDEAANALLKVLEEPPAESYFVLLVAQRSLLLPTLVSRSFCLTLPWKHCHAPKEVQDAPNEWEEALAGFLLSGRGFLERLNTKGALNLCEAQNLLLGLQESLVRTLMGENSRPLDAALAKAFARSFAATSHRESADQSSPGYPALAAKLSRWLNESQDMLDYGVNPARILEALASHLRLELV